MKKILLILLFPCIAFSTNAQSLTIKNAEKCFSLTKDSLIIFLEERGFTNQSDEELIQENIEDGEDANSLKKEFYGKNGNRRIYQLIKRHYGGYAKVFILMQPPLYKKVASINWSANFRFDGMYYRGELNKLNYELIEETDRAFKYHNTRRMFVVSYTIMPRLNEIDFSINKLDKAIK